MRGRWWMRGLTLLISAGRRRGRGRGGVRGGGGRGGGAQWREMVDAGADLIDIGGESTRPGSQRVEAGEQVRRVLPVVETLTREIGGRCVLSIDTTRSQVAKAALDAGANAINDISG